MRKISRQFCLVIFLLLATLSFADAFEASVAGTFEYPVVPDRRKPQFTTDFGYAVFPYPYSLPGLGSGIGLVGGAMNMADTYLDAYGIVFTGQVRGAAVGVADIHLIPRTLIVEAGYSTINEATIQSYSQRGMNTDKNDYRLIEFGDTAYYGARMTATFLERRFEVYGAWYEGAAKLKSIRDRDGNVIIEAENAPRTRGRNTLFGVRFDLTDDYADPRRGVRLDATRSQTPPRGSGPDYYVMDYNTTAYVPIGRRSTWAFNYLRSDAFVRREGETDRAKLEEEQGLDCGTVTDPEERKFCDEVIDNQIANNKYGTAASLGGFSRLRAYPMGRYKGAHTVFYGTELRWNLTDERTPFDIFIMRDVRTSVQVSVFYELGSTADARGDVGTITRDAYGFGLRVVTASGVVFRADLGFGREGASPAVFIGYPWEI